MIANGLTAGEFTALIEYPVSLRATGGWAAARAELRKKAILDLRGVACCPARAVRYSIQFPKDHTDQLQQDEVSFMLVEDGHRTEIRFHDYNQIYLRPGLYEQLFYDRLKCNSPRKVTEILTRTLESLRVPLSELRVLDLGAGNGMMGEELNKLGVARLVGADIIPEARDAALRDRPDVYDDYIVADFTDLSDEQTSLLKDWRLDCLTSVAALGFGDIPPRALFNALNLVNPEAWIAFNIKETFLDHSDNSGFSRFVREMIFSKYLDVWHLERYPHRLSMEGELLFYYALVARKRADIPQELLDAHID